MGTLMGDRILSFEKDSLSKRFESLKVNDSSYGHNDHFTMNTEPVSSISRYADTSREITDAVPGFLFQFREKNEKQGGEQMLWSNWNEDEKSSCSFQLESVWNLPALQENFEAVLTLDQLAEEHLQNYAASNDEDKTAGGKFVRTAEPLVLEALEWIEKDVAGMQGERVFEEELSSMKTPSSLGSVLCKKQPMGKIRRDIDICNVLFCPPNIKPFDFTTPSPDDTIREMQKAQKRGIRKQ